MKNYRIILKGSKRNNTVDTVIYESAQNKTQAFNLAFAAFEQGTFNSFAKHNPEVCGKYRVCMSNIISE